MFSSGMPASSRIWYVPLIGLLILITFFSYKPATRNGWLPPTDPSTRFSPSPYSEDETISPEPDVTAPESQWSSKEEKEKIVAPEPVRNKAQNEVETSEAKSPWPWKQEKENIAAEEPGRISAQDKGKGARPDAVWLIAVMTAANQRSRRDIIRETWGKMFADPRHEILFVLGNYNKIWEPLIQEENSTHHDILELPNVVEDYHTANTIKSIEFFKYISTNAANRKPAYKYVSKVDDDLFPNLPSFYRDFMDTRLRDTPERSIVCRPIWVHKDFPTDYPSGRFYTLSWDLVLLLVDLYNATPEPIVDEHEDRLVGRLLYEANEPIKDWGNFTNKRAFDIGWEGWIDQDTLMAHDIKDDERYLEVGSLFNETGYNGKYFKGLTDFDRSFPEVVKKKGKPEKGEGNTAPWYPTIPPGGDPVPGRDDKPADEKPSKEHHVVDQSAPQAKPAVEKGAGDGQTR